MKPRIGLGKSTRSPILGSRPEVCTDDIPVESKQLKQLIRDVIDPSKLLGHSDTPVRTKKDMSRAKNVVQATATEDGPVNTLEDKARDTLRSTQ
jgi:hypothetical protein